MLRTLFVLIIATMGGLAAFRGPFYALLWYLWIAYFRPETWVWSNLISSLRLSLVSGFVLVGLLVFSRERFRFDWRILLMGLFLAQSALSLAVSPHAEFSYPFWVDFLKSTLVSYAIATLVTDVWRLRTVLLVITFSLGFEATKQGWVQLVLNPGGQNFNMLPSIGDNNGAAIGTLMIVPITLSLANTAQKRWERYLHRFVAVGVLYRAIVTYSRGGFLALMAFGTVHWFRSRWKLRSLLAMCFVGALIAPVLPDAFWDRMLTIGASSEERDASAQGRLHFWAVAVEMANDRPFTGVGHLAFNNAYDQYDFSGGEYGHNRSVHSSIFAVLAECGYPGLILFAANVGAALFTCRKVRKLAAKTPAINELGFYASALEASLVIFMVGGSFVIFQYTEIVWHVIALTMALHSIAVTTMERATVSTPAAETPKPVPAFKGVPVWAPKPTPRPMAPPAWHPAEK